MGKPLRRRLQPEARKLEIIEAAERLLAAEGSRVRVEDVVREAGIAKGTFFLYFPTWDDLLETVRQRLVSAFDTANPLPTEANGPIDWPGLVESQAAAFIDWTLSRQGFGEQMNAAPAFASVERGALRLLLSGDKSSAGRPMPDGRQPEAGGWNRFQLIVEDIAAEVDRLRARGVSFRNDVLSGPGGSQILAEDPSGNVVELFQPAGRG